MRTKNSPNLRLVYTVAEAAELLARESFNELDLRVEFLERRRVRGGDVPSVPDVEWN